MRVSREVQGVFPQRVVHGDGGAAGRGRAEGGAPAGAGAGRRRRDRVLQPEVPGDGGAGPRDHVRRHRLLDILRMRVVRQRPPFDFDDIDIDNILIKHLRASKSSKTPINKNIGGQLTSGGDTVFKRPFVIDILDKCVNGLIGALVCL